MIETIIAFVVWYLIFGLIFAFSKESWEFESGSDHFLFIVGMLILWPVMLFARI